MPKSRGRKKGRKSRGRSPRVYRERTSSLSEPDESGTDVDHQGHGPWLVIGRIVGPALPRNEVTIGSVRIVPTTLIPPDSLKRLPARPWPSPWMSFQDVETGEVTESVSVAPPAAWLESRWIFVVQTEIEDSSEAQEWAEEKVRSALSALHLNAPAPYTARVLRLERQGEGSMPSAWTSGHLIETAELTESAARVADQFVSKLSANSVARAVKAFIERGVTLDLARVALPEVAPAVLLNYFMAIERVSDEVTGHLRKDLEDELQRRSAAVAKKLRDQLRSEISDDASISLIRDGAKEFSRIRFMYADLKIQRAGEELRIPEATIESAREFSHFRNAYLGHPRTDIPPAEIGRWFEDDHAFSLSNSYFKAYLATLPN